MVNFDWFVPEHSFRLTEEEIRGWCRKDGLEIIWFNAEAGYSVRALKK